MSTTNDSTLHPEPASTTKDPSVIVGMACRVPGATNSRELWDVLEQRKDLQRKMPDDRYNADSFYHPHGTNKGTVRLETSKDLTATKRYRAMPDMGTISTKVLTSLMPSSSTYLAKKPKPWIPNKDSYLKWCTRHSKMVSLPERILMDDC